MKKRMFRSAAILGVVTLVSAFLFATAVSSSTPPGKPDKSGEKPHSKLDASLRQKAEAGAPGHVRVVIEVLPGRASEVIQAAAAVGGVFEASYENLVQAVIPANALNALSAHGAVKLVRVPMTPLALS